MAASSLHQLALAPISSSSCHRSSSRRVLRRIIRVAGITTLSTRRIRRGCSTLFSSAQRNLSPLAADHDFIQSSTEASASSAQPWWQEWPRYQVYDENSRHFRHGPLPGDLAELEAFCRIFRLAEQMHNAVIESLIFSSKDKCVQQSQLNSEIPHKQDEEDSGVEDALSLEDKVVSCLGRIGALLHQQKEDVLGGRLRLGTSLPDSLPPLSQFRAEMHRCCKDLEVDLCVCFPLDNEQFKFVHRKLQKLVNICFDSGYARTDDEPDHADIPNWGAVHLHRPYLDGRLEKGTAGLVLWKGGRITEEGLQWLIGKGFRAIVDLRAEAATDELTNSFLGKAVSAGTIRHFWLLVNQGSSPSKDQVAEFARLAADPQNHPLYFYSQVGLGRTLSMVSRLCEFSSRSDFEKGAMPTGKPSLESSYTGEEKELRHNSLAAKHGVTMTAKQSERNGSLSEDQTCCLLGESIDKQADPLSNIVTPCSPFEAQRLAFHSFSRHGVHKFLKGRQASPTNFQFNCKPKKVLKMNAADHDEASTTLMNAADLDEATTTLKNTILEPAGRWGFDGPGIPRAGRKDDPLSENGYPMMTSNEVGKEVDSLKNENGSLTLSKGALFQVAELENSEEEADEPVVGNMCSSTTGVVRLQSRKKAEMYLVRTDGFSCTREKVKESTLAFTHPSTQQQMLMWKTAPRTVLLLKKLGNELMQAAQQVASFLHYQEGMNVIVEPEVHDHFARIPGFGFIQTYYAQDTSNLHERVDFVVCLGGDGVILHASNLFRNAVPPVVSFNLGSLGFLTAHLFKDFMQDLRAIIHGNSRVEGVYITLRMRLRCELFRNGRPVPGKIFEVLNEVVLDRGSSPYLCKIECYERNRLITKVQADGVIVATPTGSTAYSTSAGGSMVHPNVPCMLFTPICPHSLSFRPVILPDSALLELKVPEDARSNAWVSFDGKKRQQLSRGDSLRICMSEHPLPTVNKSDQTDDWFRSLVRCLNWNERLEQKTL
ncbi:hypothetical protein GOP47_0014587 [Adiantum capillus-veneris]|uniref:NAD(+) kinase n=1 Tax=Adiantum capillus-veneris TaxID=13818 RepID=A0A9D4UMB3_ADICA|nr:hypothetical protein GOP47_0014587 [Adiantum capillus-veneris]